MSAVNEEGKKGGRPLLDYLTFVVWSAPALLAAAFAQIFLVPRLKKVIEHSPTNSDTMEDVGKIVTVLPEILFFHSRTLLIVVGVLIVILELAAKWWPPRRKTGLMVVAWLVNVATLIGLSLLATCILMFALA